jgi:hypothetical protein
VVSGGRLSHATLVFQPCDLFDGEVRRRLEPACTARSRAPKADATTPAMASARADASLKSTATSTVFGGHCH